MTVMLTFACAVLTFCVGWTFVEGNAVSPRGSVVEVANRRGFNIFIDLINEASLKNRLLEGKYVIFAPTDEAFEKFSATKLSELRSDSKTLEKFLFSHISDQDLQPESLSDGTILTSLTPNQELRISVNDAGSFVNGKNFDKNGIKADNGILYRTDEVLYSLSSLSNNKNPNVNESSSNPGNLMQVLRDKGCKTFVELIVLTNISDILETSGPYTIFAPNDEAFADLDSSELSRMKSNGILLKNLIMAHIIGGEFLSTNLDEGLIIESLLSGYSLQFLGKENGSITVNNIPITLKDSKASNGVVQVIRNILISSSKSLKSDSSPVELNNSEDSISDVEREVESVVEVNGLLVENSDNKINSIFYAINENANLLPATLVEIIGKKDYSIQNGEDLYKLSSTGNILTGNESETAVNPLQTNNNTAANLSEYDSTPESKVDSLKHADLRDENSHLENVTEMKEEVNTGNVTEGSVNENEHYPNQESDVDGENSTSQYQEERSENLNKDTEEPTIGEDPLLIVDSSTYQAEIPDSGSTIK